MRDMDQTPANPDPARRAKAESGAAVRLADLQPTWTDKDGQVHRKRILTGDRTTGKLHLGHYVGSLRNRVKLQHEFDTFILLADVQALTTHWEKPEILRQSVMDVALDYMAVGLIPYTGGADDGTKAKIVIQSMVPAIAELTVYYGLVTPMSLIMDNPTTKAEAEQHGYFVEKSKALKTLTEMESLEEESLNAPNTNCPDELPTPEDEQRLDEEFQYNFSLLLDATKLLHKEFPEINIEVPDFDYYIKRIEFSKLGTSTQKEIESSGITVLAAATYRDRLHAFMYSRSFRKEVRQIVLSELRTAGLRQMTYGFLGYPVSQAADITFVNAHLVPVGEDQLPHIELTREIARRMNKQYGGRSRLLVEPQALIGGGGTLKALDGGAKMSKSLGNAIYLSDTDEAIWSQLKRAVTDPQRMRRDDPGRPEICNVYAYHKHFNEESEPSIKDAGLNVPTVAETAELCQSAGIGCVECKKNLAAKLKALLDPMRERRADWAKRPDDLKAVLMEGTRRGAEEGDKTLSKLRQAMQIDYFAKK
jgi:tryptophanyl-tRNA synthetase